MVSNGILSGPWVQTKHTNASKLGWLYVCPVDVDVESNRCAACRVLPSAAVRAFFSVLHRLGSRKSERRPFKLPTASRWLQISAFTGDAVLPTPESC